MTKMMKAARLHQFGGPKVLVYEDVPQPEPGPGQVLIRVRAAGVGPWDGEIRRGEWKAIVDYALPLILGMDLSGEVEAVGYGVDGLLPGQAVYGVADMTLSGSNAEYALGRAEFLAPKPAVLDHVRAAAVPVVATTAWQMLFDLGGLASGQTALVHGAAGGIGQFAVQLARAAGARVLATASGRDIPYLRGLGADEVIDYRTARFEDVSRDVDVVIDTVGRDTRARSWQVLRPGGILVASSYPLTDDDEAAAAAHSVRATFVEGTSRADLLAELARRLDAGALAPDVGLVVPLAEARRAHEALDGGHRQRGKIVLVVRPD